MKSGLVCLACLLGAFSLAPAFERTIILPDSFGGLEDLLDIAHNTVTNRLYVSGETGDRIIVIDATTLERVGVIELPADLILWRLDCDPTSGRLYGIGYDEDHERLAVIDCDHDSVVRTIAFDDYALALCANTVDHKVYCHIDGQDVGILLVADGVTGQFLAQLPAPMPTTDEDTRDWLVHDTRRNRIYCPGETEFGARLTVVSGADDRIVAAIDLPGCYPSGLVIDTLNDRLLWVVETESTSAIAVIDAANDSIVDFIGIEDMWFELADACYNAYDDRLYLLDASGCISLFDIDRRIVEDAVYLPDESGLRFVLRPDGLVLYCIDEYSVYVIDCVMREMSAWTEVGLPRAIAVNPQSGSAYCIDVGGDRIREVGVDGAVIDDVWTGYDVAEGLLDDARGRVYITNRSQNTVLVYDAATAALLASIPVTGDPDALCINSNHPKLYCSSTYDKLTVIDLDSLAVETTLTVGRDPESLYYNAVTDRLYCASKYADLLDVVDGVSNKRLAGVPVLRNPRAMCADPKTGRLFCAASAGSSVYVLDGRSNAVLATLDVGEDPRSLSFHPGRRLVYCANYDDRSITVIDADRLTVSGSISPASFSYPRTLAIDPTLDRLYCRTAHDIAVLDCQAESVVQRINVPSPLSAALDRPRDVVFAINAGRVYAIDAARGATICSWDTLHSPRTIVCGESIPHLYVLGTASRIIVLDKPEMEQPLSSPTGPTLLKSELTLLGTRAATVHDITGRRVTDFSPGRNDLSRLPAGIYFIRRDGEQKTAKVVITR